MNKTIGELINHLRQLRGLRMSDLAQVLNISPHLLGKVVKGEREFSFLMAVRLLEYFELSMDEFCSMLSEKELNRTDLSTIRYNEKMEIRQNNIFE